MTGSRARDPVYGPFFISGRLETGELLSPCPDFKVFAFRIYGKDLFEAYRVGGEGSLYSVTTSDLAELHETLREACEPDTHDETTGVSGGSGR